MQPKPSKTRCKQSGFTMIEMLIATVVFVVVSWRWRSSCRFRSV